MCVRVRVYVCVLPWVFTNKWSEITLCMEYSVICMPPLVCVYRDEALNYLHALVRPELLSKSNPCEMRSIDHAEFVHFPSNRDSENESRAAVRLDSVFYLGTKKLTLRFQCDGEREV